MLVLDLEAWSLITREQLARQIAHGTKLSNRVIEGDQNGDEDE